MTNNSSLWPRPFSHTRSLEPATMRNRGDSAALIGTTVSILQLISAFKRALSQESSSALDSALQRSRISGLT
jgi:hypothetical protein